MEGWVWESMGVSRNNVIVCPFCGAFLSFSFDFDSIHKCDCGACYKVCSNDMLEKGLRDVAGKLLREEELIFAGSIPIDMCDVVVEKNFDIFLSLTQSSDEALSSRFCKYDKEDKLSLVWVRRCF